MNSDLEDILDAPITGTAAEGDNGSGRASGGGSLGTLVSSSDTPTRRKRGRPSASSRLHGSGVSQPIGVSGAAKNYIRATGIGDSPLTATDRDAGTGDYQAQDDPGSSEEGTGLLRETPRRGQQSPEAVPLPISTGAKRGRPRKVDVTEVEEKHVAHGICAIFGGIFTLLTVFDPVTPHKHWIKTTDKVRPISEPTTDWLNSLSEDARRRVQGCLIPAAILGGIAQVVGPDIQIEMEYKKLKRQAMIGVPPSPPPQAGTMVSTPTPGNPVMVAQSIDEPTNGKGPIVPVPIDL